MPDKDDDLLTRLWEMEETQSGSEYTYTITNASGFPVTFRVVYPQDTSARMRAYLLLTYAIAAGNSWGIGLDRATTTTAPPPRPGGFLRYIGSYIGIS